MTITSDKNICGGKPCIEGHRLWVSRIISEVEDQGLEEFIEDFDLENDSDIRDKIKEAVDYCRNQECDKDYNKNKLIRYCQDCSKSGLSKCNGWEIAQEVYQLYFNEQSK